MLGVTGGARSSGSRLPFAAALAERDDVAILTITGDVDMSSSRDFSYALDDLAEAAAPRHVIDLTHATHIDSIAVGMLIGAAKLDSGSLRVVCPATLDKIFHITGLTKVLDVHPTLVSALRD